MPQNYWYQLRWTLRPRKDDGVYPGLTNSVVSCGPKDFLQHFHGRWEFGTRPQTTSPKRSRRDTLSCPFPGPLFSLGPRIGSLSDNGWVLALSLVFVLNPEVRELKSGSRPGNVTNDTSVDTYRNTLINFGKYSGIWRSMWLKGRGVHLIQNSFVFRLNSDLSLTWHNLPRKLSRSGV